jgi:glutathione S-transferase
MISKTSTSGKYCFGDSVTLADVALATQMGTVQR